VGWTDKHLDEMCTHDAFDPPNIPYLYCDDRVGVETFSFDKRMAINLSNRIRLPCPPYQEVGRARQE